MIIEWWQRNWNGWLLKNFCIPLLLVLLYKTVRCGAFEVVSTLYFITECGIILHIGCYGHVILKFLVWIVSCWHSLLKCVQVMIRVARSLVLSISSSLFYSHCIQFLWWTISISGIMHNMYIWASTKYCPCDIISHSL